MDPEEVGQEYEDNDSAAGRQRLGSHETGQDGAVPDSDDGVKIGAGSQPNTFEPEEDPDATRDAT